MIRKLSFRMHFDASASEIKYVLRLFKNKNTQNSYL